MAVFQILVWLSETVLLLQNLLVLALLAVLFTVWATSKESKPQRKVPVSVNYHFTRRCNKTCGFCFHTAKTSHLLTLPEAQRGLSLLKAAGMRKINFAGGEPFLNPDFLGKLAQFCKEKLDLESVSIVTNGSLVRKRWFEKYGAYIDIIAVSCDSFDEQTNIAIGRGDGNNVTQLKNIASWCRDHGIKFKLNTVVCKLNYQEDMSAQVAALQPFRWKAFQVLMVAGENDSEETLRDVRKFQISSEEFRQFCARHEHLECLVPEPNELMAKSYLILDEYMRFLDRDGREPSGSILEVGVEKALSQVYWDEDGFVNRGGLYDWTREEKGAGECGTGDSKLEW